MNIQEFLKERHDHFTRRTSKDVHEVEETEEQKNRRQEKYEYEYAKDRLKRLPFCNTNPKVNKPNVEYNIQSKIESDIEHTPSILEMKKSRLIFSPVSRLQPDIKEPDAIPPIESIDDIKNKLLHKKKHIYYREIPNANLKNKLHYISVHHKKK